MSVRALHDVPFSSVLLLDAGEPMKLFYKFLFSTQVESFMYGMFAHVISRFWLGKVFFPVTRSDLRYTLEVIDDLLLVDDRYVKTFDWSLTTSRSFTSTFPSSFILIAVVERINHFMRMNKFNFRYRKSNNFNLFWSYVIHEIIVQMIHGLNDDDNHAWKCGLFRVDCRSAAFEVKARFRCIAEIIAF